MEREPKKIMNFVVTPRMKEQIRLNALREGMSMSELIKLSITHYITKLEEERPLKKKALNEYFEGLGNL